MKRQDRLKVLTEIERIENEASKFFLGPGYHVAIQDYQNPKLFLMNHNGKKIKLSEEERKMYGKYSKMIVVTRTIKSVKK